MQTDIEYSSDTIKLDLLHVMEMPAT